MSRDGPGLLLRDILRGDDPQVMAVVRSITEISPDIITLQGVDYDLELRALSALADALSAAGAPYPHRYAAPPNAGQMTDVDLDGDGRLGGPGDAQGYGRFYGQGAMAILSRYPVQTAAVQDFSALLWRDLPDASLPYTAAGPFPSTDALAIQRLSTNGHWSVPIDAPDLGTVTLLTFHATPPVFDGPEDRNGKRNHDEVTFWTQHLAGTIGQPPAQQFILLGDANLDPTRGDGRGAAITALLGNPALQDPLPDQATVSWDQTGPMRVDYILPSSDWRVVDSGIHWPVSDPASRHALIWVDLDR